MNLITIAGEAVADTSLVYLPMKAANTWDIDGCNYLPIGLPKMQD
jgi:hypothetical protein